METTIDRKIKELVFKKYGETVVRNALKLAETRFWQTFHDMLIGSGKADESLGIDIEELLLTAGVEYLYQNDKELQNELDWFLEEMGL